MTVEPKLSGTPGGDDRRTERAGRTEVMISALLRSGVITSLAIVVAGTILSFVHHPDYLRSPAAYARLTAPPASPFRTLGDVVDGLRHARGQALVELGLLVLIATPVLRVGASIGLFAIQRNRVFVATTSLVFTLLVTSFLLGRASG
jgi:uncharacterized membrane protein